MIRINTRALARLLNLHGVIRRVPAKDTNVPLMPKRLKNLQLHTSPSPNIAVRVVEESRPAPVVHIKIDIPIVGSTVKNNSDRVVSLTSEVIVVPGTISNVTSVLLLIHNRRGIFFTLRPSIGALTLTSVVLAVVGARVIAAVVGALGGGFRIGDTDGGGEVAGNKPKHTVHAHVVGFPSLDLTVGNRDRVIREGELSLIEVEQGRFLIGGSEHLTVVIVAVLRSNHPLDFVIELVSGESKVLPSKEIANVPRILNPRGNNSHLTLRSHEAIAAFTGPISLTRTTVVAVVGARGGVDGFNVVRALGFRVTIDTSNVFGGLSILEGDGEDGEGGDVTSDVLVETRVLVFVDKQIAISLFAIEGQSPSDSLGMRGGKRVVLPL